MPRPGRAPRGPPPPELRRRPVKASTPTSPDLGLKLRCGGSVHQRKNGDAAVNEADDPIYAGLAISNFEGMCGPVFRESGMVPLTERDTFVDLGCGHGQVLRAVREVCPNCVCWGIDLDPACYRAAKSNLEAASAYWPSSAAPVGLVHGGIDDCFAPAVGSSCPAAAADAAASREEHGERRHLHDFLQIHPGGRQETSQEELPKLLSRATVVYMFLGEWANLRLRNNLLQALPIGCRIVTQSFRLSEEWLPDAETWIGSAAAGNAWFLYHITADRKHDPRMLSTDELARRFGLHWVQPPPNNYKAVAVSPEKRQFLVQSTASARKEPVSPTLGDCSPGRFVNDEVGPRSRAVGVLLMLGSSIALLSVYISIGSKLLPPLSLPMLDRLQNDHYYCYALPSLCVAGVIFRYWTWLAIEFFKNA